MRCGIENADKSRMEFSRGRPLLQGDGVDKVGWFGRSGCLWIGFFFMRWQRRSRCFDAEAEEVVLWFRSQACVATCRIEG